MAKNNAPPVIVFILLFFLLAGGGYWFLLNQNQPNTNNNIVNNPSAKLRITEAANQIVSNLDTSLPNPNILAMDGSVTMVKLIKLIENAYEQKYPNIPITYGVPEGKPNGSNQGIKNLIENRVQIAAISRTLRPEESSQANIKLIPIAKDALAIVVGINNPYKGSLTLEQLKDIYQGKIVNWSEVGGDDLPIKVINRSPKSGSYNFFQDVVLLGESFAPDSSNFITYQRDVTTPILRELNNNGISYTTVAQAKNQTTVRIVPINGISPIDKTTLNNDNYPLSRSVFLAVPNQTSLAVKNFIELALSTKGQQLVQQADFIPLE
ncbi:MAG: phosphate ABC transporter substrate-binding protein [Okeania sp. SIO3C4]|nr:phosphate ABC transporter substrate-binding protein [Okeania sp. SIO3B3]NER06102.1 phosphate ABC transporter substrate-binding protein [Okeania sp. SIO3C4]